MVILEPDGTLSHTDTIDLTEQPLDDSSTQDASYHRADAVRDEHSAFDVFGLHEVAREIEQAAARISSELHQLAFVNELPVFQQRPLFRIPVLKVR
jgi:hypothetical protein